MAEETHEARQGNTLPVVMNRSAGRGSVSAQRLQEILDDAGIAAAVRIAGGSLDEAIASLVAAGAHRIGIAGGDGTVRTAAQVVMQTDTALAVLPIGTLNHFSRGLGIDSLEAAASAIAAGTTARLTAGVVNGTVFLNTATFGLYADVLRRRERMRRWIGKWPAALVAFLVTIARFRPVELALELNGIRLERATALVWVGLGVGSFPRAWSTERRGSPDLEVAILRAHTRGQLLTLGFRTALGIARGRRPVRDARLEFLHTRSLSVRSRHHAIGVTLDGEIIRMDSPLDVAVHDNAVRWVVAAP